MIDFIAFMRVDWQWNATIDISDTYGTSLCCNSVEIGIGSVSVHTGMDLRSSVFKRDISESRIFLTHDPDLKGHQKTKERWNENVHLYYSDDFFKT